MVPAIAASLPVVDGVAVVPVPVVVKVASWEFAFWLVTVSWNWSLAKMRPGAAMTVRGLLSSRAKPSNSLLSPHELAQLAAAAPAVAMST